MQGKPGAHSAEVEVLAAVFEKSATELKQKLFRCKITVHIVKLNVRTWMSSAEHNIDIVCMQEHRYYHSKLEIKYHDTGNRRSFISASSWKYSVNAVIERVEMP